jgi:hypothetical protein
LILAERGVENVQRVVVSFNRLLSGFFARRQRLSPSETVNLLEPMNLLLQFKEWLTLPDAASHLSTIFAQSISEADVLRLALDRHLRLSVNFVNGAQARRGKVVGPDGIEWGEFPVEVVDLLKSVPEECRGKPLRYAKSLGIDDERFLNLDESVSTIWGVWEIPMLGGDKLDVEHRYQLLTDGPSITVTNLEGTFVESLDGLEFCQLQDTFDDNEYQEGSKASGEAIEERIVAKGLSDDQATELRARHKSEREVFRSKQRVRPWSERFYPAGGLPEDAVFVVRVSELLRLQERVASLRPNNGGATRESGDVSTKERTTFLAMIGLVAHAADLDLDELPKLILQAAAEKGIEISRRTVEDKVKAVRVAMQDRTR